MNKWTVIHFIYISALITTYFIISGYWLSRDSDAYLKKWDNQTAIEKYYENKTCSKNSCDTPTYACMNYCYNKDVKKEN